MKLEVIKDCYYVSDGRSFEHDYLDKEELFNMVSHLLVEGDIWETDKDDPEFFICISGEWEGESSDGWWEHKNVSNFFKEI